MTREEIEIYEKLIMANNLYTEHLVKLNKTIEQLIHNQESLTEEVIKLNKYFREVGEHNFQGIIKSTVTTAVKDSNKPFYIFLKYTATLIALVSAVYGLLNFLSK